VGDLWTLRGLGADDDAASWIPLELPGAPPSARKGAAMAGPPAGPASRLFVRGVLTPHGTSRWRLAPRPNPNTLRLDLGHLLGHTPGADPCVSNARRGPASTRRRLTAGAAAPRAAVGLWLAVMGGRTAELGWFRTRTDTFHNDLVAMDRDGDGAVRWTAPAVTGDAPGPREFHSLTPLSGGRLFLFGGAGHPTITTLTLDRAWLPLPCNPNPTSKLPGLNARPAGRAGGNGKQIFGDAWWLETGAAPYLGSAVGSGSVSQLSDSLFPAASPGKPAKGRGSTGAPPAPPGGQPRRRARRSRPGPTCRREQQTVRDLDCLASVPRRSLRVCQALPQGVVACPNPL
jgi:hypothetical protein